ncbi:DNA mismatch endonuclease Vsr [Mesorhizobium sp. AR10]|uniref:very short patch repair endonuclease n=1 Tax=Mesorhizobium sp. AR10 TaxID=2865839 RepID=UPI00215E6FCD|nr:DNA mismatch endonuclease Vsr [Mesorhizobium sp. AR10]UVK39382.1 DNA mismatch endonuclease Vsr [Mesorhizobium sp. AR10]
MADTLTRAERSERMSRIGGKNTKPEMVVRQLVHSLGHRYRLHCADLPGCPDLVFPARRKVIFVHGCFWHRHPDSSCKLSRLPKSREDFWIPKLKANAERDIRNEKALNELGWEILVIWECEIKDRASLQRNIEAFLHDEVN